jgi:hypothetical protein
VTRVEHLAAAKAWLAAPSKSARNKLYKKNGVCWSELLNLLYWDPTIFAIIDGMHNLFLGLVKHHFREIIGTEWKETSDEEVFHEKEVSDKEMAKGRRLLQENPTNTKLQRLKVNVLQNLCREYNVLGQIDGKQIKKKQYIKALQVGHWVVMPIHF